MPATFINQINIKKFFYLFSLFALLLSCSEENNVEGNIVGSWAFESGSVFIDGTEIPSEDAQDFISFDNTAVLKFNADGTMEFSSKQFGDESSPGNYSLDKQTRVLKMTISYGDDYCETVSMNAKRLTDKELHLQKIEENVNIEYKDGEWNYDSEKTHTLLIESRFNRI